MQFFNVKSPTQVRQLLGRVPPEIEAETLPVAAAVGRVLAAAAVAPTDLPEFPRAVVDGYAVRAADTFGASPGLPAFLRVVGEVRMGEPAAIPVTPGAAVRIATGGMLPAGADAVVMIEQTEVVDEATIELFRAAAPFEGMVRQGDDARAGETLVAAGRRLRPQDLGALAAAGITRAAVYRRPRVAVIPTGDEVVPPDQAPAPGQVRDVNTIALCAAILELGGEPRPLPIVPDEPDRLAAAVDTALRAADLVLLAGGSSVGARDWTLAVLTALPGAELLAHGVAIRPGKPVILVAVGDRLLVGLPGNPVSALIVFQQFVAPYLARLGGERAPLPRGPVVRATLTASCRSEAGKEDYVRVRLCRTDDGWLAEPLLGKSTLIRPMVEADGLVVIAENLEGLEAGAGVDVLLF
jgi:molybdopterin molybdotransferase